MLYLYPGIKQKIIWLHPQTKFKSKKPSQTFFDGIFFRKRFRRGVQLQQGIFALHRLSNGTLSWNKSRVQYDFFKPFI